MHREGDEDDDVARHCRIEDVESEAAIEVLGDDDAEQGSRARNPPGRQRGKGECQQCRSDEGAVIGQCSFRRATAQVHHQCFAGDAERGGYEQIENEAGAEEIHVRDRRGQERQQHLLHRLGNVGRRREIRGFAALEIH